MFGEDWEANVEKARATDARAGTRDGWDARGLRGGVPVEQAFWVLVKLSDGKVTQSAVYTDREQALEAAGLSE